MAETRAERKERARARQRYLGPDEVSMFCEQVALILKSGIPMHDGVEALCENYHDTRYADTFKKIENGVKETGSLADAVERTEIFPPYMVQMVRIGERAGKLDDVMEGLGLYYGRESKVHSAVRGAVAYPIMLMAMMAVVMMALVSQVLPIFTRVFRSLGTEMDASMTGVMNLGMAVGYGVLVVVALTLVMVLAGVILSRLGRQKQMNALIRRAFPPVCRVMEKTSAGRFASVLSMMMAAGFPIGEAMGMIPGVLSDEKTREKVRMCARQMSDEGVGLPTAIANAGLFAPVYNKMIQVGFSTGQMDRVMSRLADIHEEEVDDGIRRLVGLIEPSLVAILAVMIGGILLAVMLPLASILSGVL